MKEKQHHFLCPLDGSERAEAVLAALMPLVRAGESRVTLLEVLTRMDAPIDARSYATRVRDALRAHHVPAECEYRTGTPADQILSFARESQADLIALATRGRTGLSRLFRGSVTEEVLRHADVPVLISRSGQRLRDWKRILVPLDESVSVKPLLSDVSYLARQTGAAVELHHAVLPVPLPGYGTGAVWMDDYGSGPNAFTPFLKEVADRMASTGIKVHPVRRWILSASGILDRVKAGDIDLVCMTTHGRTGLSRFFMGSMAEEVVRRAACPVFVRRSGSSVLASPEESLIPMTAAGVEGKSGLGGPPRNQEERFPS
jgi:nucleotide-binding universal stress UspA family protein